MEQLGQALVMHGGAAGVMEALPWLKKAADAGSAAAIKLLFGLADLVQKSEAPAST